MAKKLPPPARCCPNSRLLLLGALAFLLAACAMKPEQRIEDPSCQYCYELPSGVTYKTFQYYDP